MKTIATINFKGGVGKTTATWALGYVASRDPRISTLMFDLDAQMSLTQSIALNEDGSAFKSFSDWHDRSVRKKKTIFDALDEYAKPVEFKFTPGRDFIYEILARYHFVPSIEDLYWTELELFDKERIKSFVQCMLEKIKRTQGLPKYSYVLFDCPPSFSLLSYSVLSCCDLVLIPINPDFFAAKGLDLLLKSLRMRIEPAPMPKVGVFMNRAKRPGGKSVKRFSNETQRYLDDASDVLNRGAISRGMDAKLFRTAIFDRVGMKRAIQEGMPADFQTQFQSLWEEIQNFLSE